MNKDQPSMLVLINADKKFYVGANRFSAEYPDAMRFSSKGELREAKRIAKKLNCSVVENYGLMTQRVLFVYIPAMPKVDARLQGTVDALEGMILSTEDRLVNIAVRTVIDALGTTLTLRQGVTSSHREVVLRAVDGGDSRYSKFMVEDKETGKHSISRDFYSLKEALEYFEQVDVSDFVGV